MPKLNEKYGKLADEKTIQKTIEALKKNGITAIVVDSGTEAKEKVLELVPKKAEVMTMSSETLRTIGLVEEMNESGNYSPVRKKLEKLDDKTQSMEKRRLGAAQEYALGSVHAITENGEVLIASKTGSQLPAYAFGANKVIWVAGAQKIVKDFEDGIKRIYQYTFPLENERAMKAYGMASGVDKILVINKEIQPDRMTLIIVKEKLGF